MKTDLLKVNLNQNHQNSPAPRHPVPTPLVYLSCLLLGSGVTLLGVHLHSSSQFTSALSPTTPTEPAPSPSTTSLLPPPNFVSQVVQEVGPAVVQINAARTVDTQVPEIFNDPFFRRFFGEQIPSQPPSRVERGVGSGFILSADGLILTNAHVVDSADTVTVTLKDGRTLDGKVLGTDSVTDVAVIKVDATGLPTIKIGDADTLQPGEWAIAIGNPLGLDNTVTVGIISATGRSSSQVGIPDKRVAFIQTDAAINPGNSGGPLLNQNGEVIGMNTAIIQGAQGLGFAIPINRVQFIADQLIANGKVNHPYLGIQMVALTPEMKNEINNNPNSGLMVTEDQGILIVRVMPNSPAAEAGLRAGDVIKKIKDQPMQDANMVQKMVESSEINQELPIEIRRNGQSLTIPVRPGTVPGN